MKFLFLLFLFCCCNHAYGQYSYCPPFPFYSYQTPYFYSYQIPYQTFRRQLTLSEIRERWAIQDEYKERNRTENYLDRKERMLDQSERAYELSKREDDLRRRGILPPKKPTKIVFHDTEYSSYEELSQSDDYQFHIISKKIERQEQEWLKKYEKERSNAFLQMWHRLSDIGKEQFSRLSSEEKEIRIDEFHFENLLR